VTAEVRRAPARPGALAYVPALDGVRGLAVLAVLLFHAGVGWIPGGFLGVDAFFVLSGYLITTILLSGDSGLREFWDRRARRLVPALLALTFVVVAFGLVAPLNASPRDGLATLTYVSNWRSILGGGGYFGSFAAPSAFKHTWSLAVEGQFYLVWPLLVVLVCRRKKRSVLLTAGVGALASAAAMATSFRPYGDPARAYYGTDTRIQALFVGAALAVVLFARTATLPRRAFLSVSGVLGAIYTIVLWHRTSGTDPRLYRGGFLLAAVATAAVIASVVAVPGGPLARWLAARPLVAVGKVSYGVYLWHWPVFLLMTHERTHLPGVLLLVARFAVVAALSVLSWKCVEVPARTWRPRTPTAPELAGAGRRLALAAAALVLLTAGTHWIRSTPPAPVASAEVGAVPRQPLTPTTPPASPSATPRAPLAKPAASASASAAARPKGDGTGSVMFIGDSVAQTLAAGLRDADGVEIVNEGILGCGLTVGGPYRYFGGQYEDLPKCAAWETDWTAALTRHKPDVVAILVGRWECMDRLHDGQWMHLGDAAYDAYVDAQLDRAITLMSAGGARVALLTAPYYKRGERPDGGRFPEDDPARVDRFNEILRAVAARHDGVRVIDLHTALAPEGKFTKRINGTLVRYDGVHISGGGARLLTPWLMPELKAALSA
jgi:peptidoglycan/LPS O-acetylase OafA/YrhL